MNFSCTLIPLKKMPFDYHEHKTIKHSAYSIPLNKSNLDAFKIFAQQYIDGDMKGIKKGKVGLKNAQYSNFQNLRHFGIIEQSEKAKEWHLTEKGLQFYRNEIPISSPAGFLAGETLEPDHPAWKTFRGIRELVYINGNISERTKVRPEYQGEKSGDTLFSFNDYYE